MWDWLENTPIARLVGESLWAYPFLLGLHIIGLAVLVGIFTMRDLRLLGMFSGLQPSAFLAVSKLAWVGFIVNAVSGSLLFTSQASTLAHSAPFLFKLCFIIAGLVVAAIIQTGLRGRLASGAAIDGTTKLIALASLLSWLGVIVSGRLIAYL